MKRNIICLMIICAVELSSCVTQPTTEATLIPQRPGIETQTIVVTPTPYIVNWTSSPLGIDATFDDILSYIETEFDFSADMLIQDNPERIGYTVDRNGHHILYIPDFSEQLVHMTTPDPVTGITSYYPEEYEYHIIRRIKIDELCIDELENETWAMEEYCITADQILYGNDPMDGSLIYEGCFFDNTEDNTGRFFHAGYYFGEISICYSFSFNHESADNYNVYRSMCEEFGLPTCQEITEEIVGDQ